MEKPEAAVATELMGRGAVWNSFVLVSTASTIVELFEARLPGVTSAMRDALRPIPGDESSVRRIAEVYDVLASFDFCRDVLEGFEHRLSVLPVPHCGWSDLGTPERVARCMARRGPSRRYVTHGPVLSAQVPGPRPRVSRR